MKKTDTPISPARMDSFAARNEASCSELSVSMPTHTASPPPAPRDIIAQLADDYDRAVQDPDFLATLSQQGMSPAAVVLEDELPPMSWADQKKYAALFPAHYSAEDIINGPLTIDSILDKLGPETEDLFKPPVPEDILMLFADEKKQEMWKRLPETTRRDHHASSIDSHITFIKPSTDEEDDA